MNQAPEKKISSNAENLSTYLIELKKYKGGHLNVGLVTGTFDLMHRGHQHLINEAAKNCDFLVVQIHSDEQTKRRKGANRPINSREDRAYAVASIYGVGAVLIDPDNFGSICSKHFNQLRAIQKINPDIVFLGSDSQHTLLTRLNNTKSTRIPRVMQISYDFGRHTSDIIKQIRADMS